MIVKLISAVSLRAAASAAAPRLRASSAVTRATLSRYPAPVVSSSNAPRFDRQARLFWFRSSFSDPNRNAAEAERLVTSVRNPTATHPDIVAAAEFAQKAVDEGSPRGKTLLGSFYREGMVVPKDLDKAEQLFLEASEEGDPFGQCSLGNIMLDSLKPPEPSLDPKFDVSYKVDEKGQPVATRLDPIGSDPNANPNADENTNSADPKDKRKRKKSRPGFETPAELVRMKRKERRKAGFTDTQAFEYEEFKESEEEKRRERVRAEAHEWLERAIDQGNDTAMLVLAQDLQKDKPERSVELFQQAANDYRNSNAYYVLGQIYERGGFGGVERDFRESFKYYSMGAQLGNLDAQLYMALMYKKGSFVVKQDTNLALKYMKMAVDQNHPPALHYYSLWMREGECGLPVDLEAFRRYNKQAADLEHGPAVALRADILYKGSDGVKTDYAQALELFTKAGHLGETEAFGSAASMYFNGTGVKKDYFKALDLYQNAAVKNNVNALRNLASMHFYGHGTPVNKKLSENFMKVADDIERKREKATKYDHSQTMTEPVPKDAEVPLVRKPRPIPPKEQVKEYQDSVHAKDR